MCILCHVSSATLAKGLHFVKVCNVRSMVRGMSSAQALLLVLFCVALIGNAEAVRTHELFAHSTYEDSDESRTTATTSSEKPAVIAGDAQVLPVETVTASSSVEEYSQTSKPVPTRVVTSDRAIASQDPDAITPATHQATVFSVTPQQEQQQQQQQQQQQHYRDYRGVATPYTSTTTEGGFMPDARPWWSNPQYASYGSNFPQGSNLNQQQQQQSNGVIPNRYPLGYNYPAHFDNPQFYSQSSNPAGGDKYTSVPGSNGQYAPRDLALQQYAQGGFPQYLQYTGSNIIPYEMTGGGCPTQYWVANTQRWPAFFNVKSTVGDALGTPATKVFGDTTMLQAMLNTRPDGYSTLLRSGVTAILNSYSRSQYKFSHVQVIESFAAGLGSSQAAAEQAATFEEANVSAFADQYNSCA